MEEMIRIDGSIGEGGGQILRTGLSLAAITGKAVHFERIRGKREKPGLMRQHLACARAVCEICGGSLLGDELKSQEMTFTPGTIRGGDYHFVIGSAGSVMLLAQTVLPVLLFADGPSHLTLEGSTHTSLSPSFEFFSDVYLPCVRKMGIEAEARLLNYGFSTAGGGCMELDVKPASTWKRLSLMRRGDFQGAKVTALGSGLDKQILTDELQLFRAGLGDAAPDFTPVELEVESVGSGNVLYASLAFDEITEVFSVCGYYSISRKAVARRVLDMVRKYLGRGWVVCPYLADQLMLPMALGVGGCYLTGAPTPHSDTNRDVIRRFMDVEILFREIEEKVFEMEIIK